MLQSLRWRHWHTGGPVTVTPNWASSLVNRISARPLIGLKRCQQLMFDVLWLLVLKLVSSFISQSKLYLRLYWKKRKLESGQSPCIYTLYQVNLQKPTRTSVIFGEGEIRHQNIKYVNMNEYKMLYASLLEEKHSSNLKIDA